MARHATAPRRLQNTPIPSKMAPGTTWTQKKTRKCIQSCRSRCLFSEASPNDSVQLHVGSAVCVLCCMYPQGCQPDPLPSSSPTSNHAGSVVPSVLANADQMWLPGVLRTGRSLAGEKKSVPLHIFPKEACGALHVFNHGWWWLAVGSWWRLTVGSWQLAVGGGWWRLVVGDWWCVAVGSGWRLVAAGGWRRLAAVGGWRLVAVGGWWELAVGGWWSPGAVLKGGPEQKKNLVPKGPPCLRIAIHWEVRTLEILQGLAQLGNCLSSWGIGQEPFG